MPSSNRARRKHNMICSTCSGLMISGGEMTIMSPDARTSTPLSWDRPLSPSALDRQKKHTFLAGGHVLLNPATEEP